jgi:hypothetical protein
MVAFGEHLEGEVTEHRPEPFGFLAELVRVAQAAEREVDGTLESGQCVAVQVLGLERAHEGPDPSGSLPHPRWSAPHVPAAAEDVRRNREFDPDSN